MKLLVSYNADPNIPTMRTPGRPRTGDAQRDVKDVSGLPVIPVGGPLKRTASQRVLLAGDAGGFVNGFTAEGIYYGMVSGDLAGRALAGGSTAVFERAWRREIGAELRDSVRVQRFLFRHPARIDGMVRGARLHPDLAQTVVDYAQGRRSYRAARRRLLRRFPSLAIRILFDIPQKDAIWHNSSPPLRTS